MQDNGLYNFDMAGCLVVAEGGCSGQIPREWMSQIQWDGLLYYCVLNHGDKTKRFV